MITEDDDGFDIDINAGCLLAMVGLVFFWAAVMFKAAQMIGGS